jgi:hypothetical protein
VLVRTQTYAGARPFLDRDHLMCMHIGVLWVTLAHAHLGLCQEVKFICPCLWLLGDSGSADPNLAALLPVAVFTWCCDLCTASTCYQKEYICLGPLKQLPLLFYCIFECTMSGQSFTRARALLTYWRLCGGICMLAFIVRLYNLLHGSTYMIYTGSYYVSLLVI